MPPNAVVTAIACTRQESASARKDSVAKTAPQEFVMKTVVGMENATTVSVNATRAMEVLRVTSRNVPIRHARVMACVIRQRANACVLVPGKVVNATRKGVPISVMGMVCATGNLLPVNATRGGSMKTVVAKNVLRTVTRREPVTHEQASAIVKSAMAVMIAHSVSVTKTAWARAHATVGSAGVMLDLVVWHARKRTAPMAVPIVENVTSKLVYASAISLSLVKIALWHRVQ